MNDSRIGSTVGPYLLESVLGSGPTGTVYLATESGLNRRVAIKLIAPEILTEPGFAERFRSEAARAATLRHPHIVTVYDSGEKGGQLYVVMEWVAEGSLRGRTAGPMAALHAAGLAGQVAGALDYAHQQGVVHRDVNPSNILLENPDFAKLGDFVSGAGAAEYRSPEQIQGSSDGRGDIYSLGIVLFELLTGELPFPSTSAEEIQRQHLEKPVPVVTMLQRGVAPELIQIVLKATAKRPEQRYARAGEMEAALEAFRTRQGSPTGSVVVDVGPAGAIETAPVPAGAAAPSGVDPLTTTPLPPSDAATIVLPDAQSGSSAETGVIDTLETNPVEPGPPLESGLAALTPAGGMSTGLRIASFVGSRIAQLIVINLVVITALFYFTRVFKDPIEALGGNLDAATAGRIRDDLHLSDPLPTQYARFVGGTLTGDYGRSFRANRPASDVIDTVWPATRTLAGTSLLVALLLGIPFAALAAFLQRGVVSWLPRYLALAMQSLPVMVVGITLIYFFAVRSRALPAFGSGDVQHLVMPVILLTLVYLPAVMRAGLAFGEALRGETGRGRRLLRAFGGALSILIYELGAFIGALVIVENLFAWPGAGRLLVTAGLTRDFPVVTGSVLAFTGILAWLVVFGGIPRALADFRASSVALFSDGYRSLGVRDSGSAASRGMRIAAWLSVVALLTFVGLLVLASFAPPYDPFRASIADGLKEPGGSHLLGTDRLGRDIASRLLVAARSGLLLAFGVVLLAGIGGGIVGGLAGFLARKGAGWIAAPLVWLASTASAIPLVIWLIATISGVGPGFIPNMLLLATWLWPLFFALFAGIVIDGALPASKRGFGQVLTIAVAGFAFAIASVLINDGYLGFLGLSLPPPDPTLGGISSDGREFLSTAVWLQYAGFVLAFIAFAFSVLGDTLAGVLRIRRPA